MSTDAYYFFVGKISPIMHFFLLDFGPGGLHRLEWA